jgi:hypothetical protein
MTMLSDSIKAKDRGAIVRSYCHPADDNETKVSDAVSWGYRTLRSRGAMSARALRGFMRVSARVHVICTARCVAGA